MSHFEHLLDTNTQLMGVLETLSSDAPEVEALAGLLAVRAALLRALQERAAPAPESLRPLLREQHQKLDSLLRTRTSETQAQLARIERLEQAQSRYQPQQPRRVLQSGLNI